MATSGSSSSGDVYGKVYVVHPGKDHRATIVWLHNLGDSGLSWFSLVENLLKVNDLAPHIKWIFPTAPLRYISSNDEGVTTVSSTRFTSWFDMKGLDYEAYVDELELNASGNYVVSLFADEPPDIELAVGGFGMGAATALDFSIRVASGKLNLKENAKLRAVVAYCGWFPAIEDQFSGEDVLPEMKSSTQFCLFYDQAEDPIVPNSHSDKAHDRLKTYGFEKIECKCFETPDKLPHLHHEEPMGAVITWLHKTLNEPPQDSDLGRRKGDVMVPPPPPPVQQPIKRPWIEAKPSYPTVKPPKYGRVFLRAEPGGPSYVKAGEKVRKGQILCILDPATAINVEADRSGTVTHINVVDGDLVTPDTPLFTIKPDEQQD